MVKMLILQRLNGLSDERLRYQVTDHLSFMRFLGVELAGNVPNTGTVWAFRESLKEHKLAEVLFERLNQALAERGIELKSGQIIDATFIPVPIQRNGRDSTALIKAGAVPIQWGQDTEHPNKLAHKDTDARWTKKSGQNHYGYKNHINIDKDTKLIASHACTDASVHDSQVFEAVLRNQDAGGEQVWADSAYRGNKPLSESQKISNKAKSRVRARVEHIFGHMENSMGGIFVRSTGIARVRVGVTLMNLAYNLSRVEVLIRNKTFSFVRISAPKIATAA
jgi:IS5 family transposase